VTAQDPGVTAAAFVSRQLYGAYLEHVLERAAAASAPGVTLERVVTEVTGATPIADGTAAEVDIALELRARGRTAPMIAVSRRGLLPRPHSDHGAPPDRPRPDCARFCRGASCRCRAAPIGPHGGGA